MRLTFAMIGLPNAACMAGSVPEPQRLTELFSKSIRFHTALSEMTVLIMLLIRRHLQYVWTHKQRLVHKVTPFKLSVDQFHSM